MFRNFENFRKKLNNQVYFTETSPGIFERDKNFELKLFYTAFEDYTADNEFRFRVRDRISNLMVKSEKDKVFQNIFKHEKPNLIDVITECDRQLQAQDVYTKLCFEEMESLIKEIQTKLRYCRETRI